MSTLKKNPIPPASPAVAEPKVSVPQLDPPLPPKPTQPVSHPSSTQPYQPTLISLNSTHLTLTPNYPNYLHPSLFFPKLYSLGGIKINIYILRIFIFPFITQAQTGIVSNIVLSLLLFSFQSSSALAKSPPSGCPTQPAFRVSPRAPAKQFRRQSMVNIKCAPVLYKEKKRRRDSIKNQLNATCLTNRHLHVDKCYVFYNINLVDFSLTSYDFRINIALYLIPKESHNNQITARNIIKSTRVNSKSNLLSRRTTYIQFSTYGYLVYIGILILSFEAESHRLFESLRSSTLRMSKSMVSTSGNPKHISVRTVTGAKKVVCFYPNHGFG